MAAHRATAELPQVRAWSIYLRLECQVQGGGACSIPHIQRSPSLHKQPHHLQVTSLSSNVPAGMKQAVGAVLAVKQAARQPEAGGGSTGKQHLTLLTAAARRRRNSSSPAATHSGVWCSEGTGMAKSRSLLFNLHSPAAYLEASLRQQEGQREQGKRWADTVRRSLCQLKSQPASKGRHRRRAAAPAGLSPPVLQVQAGAGIYQQAGGLQLRCFSGQVKRRVARRICKVKIVRLLLAAPLLLLFPLFLLLLLLPLQSSCHHVSKLVKFIYFKKAFFGISGHDIQLIAPISDTLIKDCR
jgi:hypothetical protein